MRVRGLQLSHRRLKRPVDLHQGVFAVWTPKRVLILALGLLTFLVGYSIYSYFLGGIDGLPPLPEAFKPGEIEPPDERQDQETERKLKMAFGPDCEELKRPILFDRRGGGTIMAAD